MKTFVIPLLIFFSTMITTHGKSMADEVDEAFKFCLKEFGITEEDYYDEDDSESKSDSTDMDCFETCILVQIRILEDKKFNMKKLEDYLEAALDSEEVTEVSDAYKQCIDKMPEIDDECESIQQLEKCVDKKILQNIKKD